MPGKMIYAQYTADDTNTYSVKLRKFYVDLKEDAGQGGNNTLALLQFGAFDAGDPLLPRGAAMRHVRCQDPTGGVTRNVPVGQVTSRLWVEGQQTTVDLEYSGMDTLETFNRIGRTAEKQGPSAHTITNMSDAS